MTTKSETATRSGLTVVLVVAFWSYVSIPLAWGVMNTVRKAMALFQ